MPTNGEVPEDQLDQQLLMVAYKELLEAAGENEAQGKLQELMVKLATVNHKLDVYNKECKRAQQKQARMEKARVRAKANYAKRAHAISECQREERALKRTKRDAAFLSLGPDEQQHRIKELKSMPGHRQDRLTAWVREHGWAVDKHDPECPFEGFRNGSSWPVFKMEYRVPRTGPIAGVLKASYQAEAELRRQEDAERLRKIKESLKEAGIE